jgi:hypothetical protein
VICFQEQLCEPALFLYRSNHPLLAEEVSSQSSPFSFFKHLKSDQAFAQMVAYVIGKCIILSFWRHNELRGVSKFEALRNTILQSLLTASANCVPEIERINARAQKYSLAGRKIRKAGTNCICSLSGKHRTRISNTLLRRVSTCPGVRVYVSKCERCASACVRHRTHLRYSPVQEMERGWEGAETGASPVCREEAAHTIQAESAEPCLVRHRTHLRYSPGQERERGWERVAAGASPGCREEAAHTIQAESAEPCLVRHRTAVRIQASG